MRLLMLLTLLAALTVGVAAVARADPGRNLEAILRPAAGAESGFGHVKFRQPTDEDKIVYLDVWVWNLEPNHTYSVQRATDTTVDEVCTGTNWLTLGNTTTGDRGTGRAELSRDLSAIPLGTEFDIHFRVIDTATMAVVLESGCYQFTVS
jgi:hypothetical protein